LFAVESAKERQRERKRERKRKRRAINEEYARRRKYPFDLYPFLFSAKECVSAWKGE